MSGRARRGRWPDGVSGEDGLERAGEEDDRRVRATADAGPFGRGRGPSWEKGESRRRMPGGWGEEGSEGLICPPSCSNKRSPTARSAHARRGRSEGERAGPRARARRRPPGRGWPDRDREEGREAGPDVGGAWQAGRSRRLGGGRRGGGLFPASGRGAGRRPRFASFGPLVRRTLTRKEGACYY